MAVHKKYGPVVRIGPNEVSFAMPAVAKELFKTGKGFHKTDYYKVFLPNNIKDIFTEIRETVHASKKRFAVPPYSLASVQECKIRIEALMEKLLQKLDDFASSPEKAPTNLGNWLHYFAFDTLGEFAFAQPFGFLDAGSDYQNTIATIEQSTYDSAVIGQIPFLDRLTRSNPIWNYVFAGKNKLTLLSDSASEALNNFQNTKESKSNIQCLLRSLLEAHSSSPDKFTIDDVLAISMGAIGAGSDSTASTMHTFCWNVLFRSHVYAKLVAELLSSPLSDIVQYQEALALPYFQACLREAMRLQPAVGANITRQVPAGGAVLEGTHLPGGTRVAVNVWVVHRNKDIFGDDADDFNPERWLDRPANEVKRMISGMFEFGGGSHLCIGRHLALFELNKTLPQIFRRYKMELLNPERPLDHSTGFFYIQSGLKVYVSMR